VLASAFIALVSFVVMSLWNQLVPDLFAGPVISFWQALGLLVLCKILFGGMHHHKGDHRGGWKHRNWKKFMEHRMSSMTEEQREIFRRRMERCGPQWNRDTDSETK